MTDSANLLPTFLSGGLSLALVAFVSQFGAALLMLYLHPRLPVRSRNSETHEVVKLATSMIVVMTSVVLGLLATSVSSSFNAVDKDVRGFSTQLILTDRALREFGPGAAQARGLLRRYADRALHGTWPENGSPGIVDDHGAAKILDDVEQAVLTLQAADQAQHVLAAHAEQRLQSVLDQRWTLIGEAGGTVSAPLMTVVILWLALIFASLGYNAPRNRVVVAALLLSAVSMAAAIFMIMELNGPFDGLLKVSPRPLQQALATMQD